MKTSTQERIGEDGDLLAVPVIPTDAAVDEIEANVSITGFSSVAPYSRIPSSGCIGAGPA